MSSVAEIKKAIDRLFSDRSVSAEVTLENLKDLRDTIDIYIDAIETDLNNA